MNLLMKGGGGGGGGARAPSAPPLDPPLLSTLVLGMTVDGVMVSAVLYQKPALQHLPTHQTNVPLLC